VSVALFCENLSSFPADRMVRLQERLRRENLPPIEAVYALVWPDYRPPNPPVPQENRRAWARWRADAQVPLWAWLNIADGDALTQAVAIASLDKSLNPSGWMLDVEGDWSKGAPLSALANAARDTGKPRRATLAGSSASHVEYDYRALDLTGFQVSWQCYFDTGEGPPPPDGMRELYQSSFVLSGWQYRAHVGNVYGWGRVSVSGLTARYDSFKHKFDTFFPVALRDPDPSRNWGYRVVSRDLWRRDEGAGKLVGLLMGRAEYKRMRCGLDMTRPVSLARPVDEWTAIAAGARVAGSRNRPIDVYLAERDNPDCDRIVAVARGAA